MALSIRTRLTAWYSVLLVLTVVVQRRRPWCTGGCSRAVRRSRSTRSARPRPTSSKRRWRSTPASALAAEDMADVVRAPDHIVKVLDAAGRAAESEESRAFRSTARRAGPAHEAGTADGRRGGRQLWRVAVRRGQVQGHNYLIAVGAPLEGSAGTMADAVAASAIGIPLALAFAVAGGWWLGRHGLRPLTSMARRRAAITAHTTDSAPCRAAGRRAEQLGAPFNTCSTGSAAPCRSSAASWPTRRTSCGRRSRSCGPPPMSR